jgi:hypothetical protein
MQNFKRMSTGLGMALFLCSMPAFSQVYPSAQDKSSQESLRGIRPVTSRKIIVMPVSDKSGQGSSLPEFANEVLNQAIRNGGIATIAWFKVEKAMKGVMSSSNPYAAAPIIINVPGFSNSSQGLANDSNLNELIDAGKSLGASYILRPVILKQSINANAETQFKPNFGMFLGISGPTVKTESTKSAEVDVKVDIVSIREEDIIASRTFSGRAVEVSKDRANRLDGITGMQIFGQGSSMDSTKIAFYDTIDKIVEFLQDKTQ